MVLAQNYTFGTIRVDGNVRIESTAIETYAGIETGQQVSGGQLNAAYQRVLESGLFEEVEMIPQGSTLLIKVVEFPTINLIRFEGNKRLKDEVLEGIVASESRRVLNPTVVEQDAAKIAEAYSQSGRLAARVTPKIIRRNDNRADLVFEIFEGGMVEVERIAFVGNRTFSDRRLRGTLESKQAGLLRQLIQKDTFVEDRLEFDKQVLRDFYLSRGFVDFRTTSVNAELSQSRDGYFLTFNVQEGQRFSFGEVTTVSEIDGLDPAEYLAAIKLKSGKYYSPTMVENSIARMERLAIRNGEDFLRVEPRVTRNDRELTLDVEFALVRGPRIFVERIDIEGNTTTIDRVIRHQFRIVEGDPFNPREIRESAERIRALGFFEGAEVNAREGSSPDQVVVDVDVIEKPTGSLSFGGTFSTDEGIGLVVRFSESNFLGRGQTLDLSFSTSSELADYKFNFVEPAFLGRNLAAGILLRYGADDRSQTRFTLTGGQITPSLVFPVSENGRLGFDFSANTSSMEVPSSAAIPGSLIDAEAARGKLLKTSLGWDYSYDTRRAGLDPNSGVLVRVGQDIGLGADHDFIRTTALAAYHTRVLNEEIRLSATVEGGLLHSPNKDSRVSDRFILNSLQMRGFEPYGIGPREVGLTATQDDALGGTTFAVARFEAEFPLGLPAEYGITGGAFYDVGSLWGVDKTSANVVSAGSSLRHVVGLTLFWETPIGPLRFNFMKALKKEALDVEQNFNFTIRTDF